MQIKKLDRQNLIQAYDLQGHMIYPWEEIGTTPFSTAWAIVGPGVVSKSHNHHEGETFIIARGRGVMKVGDETRPVAPGDAVYIPPFHDHVLENTSATEELHFLTIWWEDSAVMAAVGGAVDGAAPAAAELLLRGNSGWAAPSAVLGADVYQRLGYLQGREMHLQSLGGDEGSAFSEHPEPSADSSEGDPGGEARRQSVERLLAALDGAGGLTLRELPTPYLKTTREWLSELSVEERCGHDGVWAAGLGCPSCGQPKGLAGGDWRAARHRRRGEALFHEVPRLCLRMAAFQPLLEKVRQSVDLSPAAHAVLSRAAAAGWPELPISHFGWHGVAVNRPGIDRQRIHPYVESMAVLLYGEGEKSWPTGSSAREERRVVAFADLAESFFWTAVLPVLSAGRPAAAYRVVEAPGAALLDDEVVSEMHRSAGGELGRLHSAGSRDAGLVESFRASTDAWLAELGEAVRASADGAAPGTGSWTQSHRVFYGLLREAVEAAERSFGLAAHSPGAGLRCLRNLSREAHQFGRAEAPWSEIEDRQETKATSLALRLLAAKTLALLSFPLLPGFAERLWGDLGFAEPIAAGAWEREPAWVPPGQDVSGLGGPYFGRPSRLDSSPAAGGETPASSPRAAAGRGQGATSR